MPGVQIRTHATVLYNSIYRFDDEMIVNPHVYGKVAAHAPALHLRRLSAGDLFTTYADSFTAVWEGATPLRVVSKERCRRRDYYDDPDAPKANSSLSPSPPPCATTAARSC